MKRQEVVSCEFVWICLSRSTFKKYHVSLFEYAYLELFLREKNKN